VEGNPQDIPRRRIHGTPLWAIHRVRDERRKSHPDAWRMGKSPISRQYTVRHRPLETRTHHQGDPDEHFEFFTTEIDNSWIKEPYPLPVETGTIVSGDRDLQPEDIPMLYEKFGARCGDWESGGIAFVCARNNTKLLILRGVSDLVGPEGGEAYDGTRVIWIEAAERIMRRITATLPEWLARY